MALSKNMGKCMSKVKKEHPKGRSKSKMSKKAAHKQHVAMCLNAQEGAISTKMMIEGMSFKSFLLAENAMGELTVKDYIRSLPTYQEMKGNDETRGPAIKLAGDFLKSYGDGPIDQDIADDIFDSFDDLAKEMYPRGANIIDWKKEKEADDRMKDDEAMDSVIDKWETETGMDAETGQEKKKYKRTNYRGATHQQGKFDKARAEIKAFQDVPPEEQAGRVAVAKSQADKPARGAKVAATRAIFQEHFGKKPRGEILRMFMDEVGMSKAGASTYYQKFKKAAQS